MNSVVQTHQWLFDCCLIPEPGNIRCLIYGFQFECSIALREKLFDGKMPSYWDIWYWKATWRAFKMYVPGFWTLPRLSILVEILSRFHKIIFIQDLKGSSKILPRSSTWVLMNFDFGTLVLSISDVLYSPRQDIGRTIINQTISDNCQFFSPNNENDTFANIRSKFLKDLGILQPFVSVLHSRASVRVLKFLSTFFWNMTLVL